MEQTNTARASAASARSVMDRVKSTATQQLSTQKSRATDGLGSIAHAVRQTTQPLRDNQQHVIAQYVEKAAEQIERLSDQLRDKDVSELVRDAQRLARRQPAVFLGVSFAAGVLAARFLKSSNHRAGNDWSGETGPGTVSRFEDRLETPGMATWNTPGTTGGM